MFEKLILSVFLASSSAFQIEEAAPGKTAEANEHEQEQEQEHEHESEPEPASHGKAHAHAGSALSPERELDDQPRADVSLITDVAGAYFSDEHNTAQTGSHDPRELGLNFQRSELSVLADLNRSFGFESHFVFVPSGVEIEEAFGTARRLLGLFDLQFGEMLVRFGQVNPTHPHDWEFVDQPLVLGRFFGPEGYRGLGAQLSIHIPVPWQLELVFSGTRSDRRHTGAEEDPDHAHAAANEALTSSFLAGTAASLPVSYASTALQDPEVERHSLQHAWLVRLQERFSLSQHWSLRHGFSSLLTPNYTGPGNHEQTLGADMRLMARGATEGTGAMFLLEAIYRRRQIPNELAVDAGGLFEVVGYLSPRWALGGRFEYVTLPRSRMLNGTPIDPELREGWHNDRHRLSLVATYRPLSSVRFRLQGSRSHFGPDIQPTWAAFLSAELYVPLVGSGHRHEH